MADKSCLLCDVPLPAEGTRWSVCEDAAFESNVWGGDSHEYVGYLCDECGERLKRGPQKS